MICRIQKSANCSKGFTIIEVLLALAIFGTAATVLTFSFTNSIIALKRQQPNRHWESDLQFVRRLVLQAKDVDELQEGDEIDTLSSGEISWEAEIEPTNLIDYYKVTVEYEIEDAPEGMDSHTEVLYLLRPAWSEGEFAGDRQELLQDKQQKLNNHRQAMGILNNFP
jgi:prepilin-type N-terminal cleavage/methylation domain-containing protein